jgi:hypothetical protein
MSVYVPPLYEKTKAFSPSSLQCPLKWPWPEARTELWCVRQLQASQLHGSPGPHRGIVPLRKNGQTMTRWRSGVPGTAQIVMRLLWPAWSPIWLATGVYPYSCLLVRNTSSFFCLSFPFFWRSYVKRRKGVQRNFIQECSIHLHFIFFPPNTELYLEKYYRNFCKESYFKIQFILLLMPIPIRVVN